MPPITSLLIANRGEIALRVIRTAADLGLHTVAVFSEDDADGLHTRWADQARPLRGSGAPAYLDVVQMVEAARAAGCDAIHPGYGFLSESAAFARACDKAGIAFVGPRPETLELFGDKAAARALAERCGVAVLAGTTGATSVDAARDFITSLGHGASVIVKAVAGGGGRGMRVVHDPETLEAAFEQASREARAAFGNGALYVERWMPHARHLEVQIIGDGSGQVSQLGERECTIQRRHQKLIEIAPSPWLSAELRQELTRAAVRLGETTRYLGLGTIEFLLDADTPGSYAFIEANARLQVEHTVTEEVIGIDLVRAQLDIAKGLSLADIGMTQAAIPAPRGFAIQLRINTEKLGKDGLARPTSGTLSAFEPPTGPGLRTDTAGHVGYATSARFDSLLAKLIAHSPSSAFEDAVRRADRGLREFRIAGVATNQGLLSRLLALPEFAAGQLHTRFVEQNAADLSTQPEPAETAPSQPSGRLIAQIDASDPLAVLAHGKGQGSVPAARAMAPSAHTGPEPAGPPGAIAVRSPLQGTVLSLAVAEGDAVQDGRALLVLESMKMEHVVGAEHSGIVRRITVAPGDTVVEHHPLLFLEETPVETDRVAGRPAAPLGMTPASHSSLQADPIDLAHVRPDLAEALERHQIGLDARRPNAVARRKKTGQRTARENLEDLCDPGSFIEYGPIVIAAQRRRRPVEELIERTPADGLIAGIGAVNGDIFDETAARTMVLAYDYTVLAGTQGLLNHRKKDRMFELARTHRLPVVFFTEGGGGRPGDTDSTVVAGLDCLAFSYWGRLSGLVPLVGINSGRCFAGNAALLGCCDVVIATRNSNIGMGGPAMIEGGGLGAFRPEQVGPIDVQTANGVVDIAVADEAEAVAVAKTYLSYFQGRLADWECADSRELRHVIPENRRRVYDVRRVIELLADTGSALELRRGFGPGMVTALVRIEGRAIGIIANNPQHLAGAIDSDGADKATRFMQLCDAFDLPILFLCDTPGIMVGPEAEKTALVRHASRMFVTGSSLTVPFFTVVLRKGYGLGAQAMAGGSFKAGLFTVAWPTGEFGGMGLEGAVKLGYRKELAAIEDPGERRRLYDEMVDRMYQQGKAVNMASLFELDDVIDPADSRHWITRALASVAPPAPRTGKKRPCIDTW
ncbi:MAG: ATP-grasp domain-containing protein [Proteobacteria bacterium]|nr:ATP-grasp domain-containing protein [Pseudomonadota bacterium]